LAGTKSHEPVCVAPTGDVCGEGPVWHAGEQALYWTDINRFLIHRFDPVSQTVKSWFFEEPVTTLSLTDRDDTLVTALGSHLLLWEPATDRRTSHGFSLDGWPSVRFNDGRADPGGSFWVGSMRNNVNQDGSSGETGGKDGALYSIAPDGSVRTLKQGVGIANTLAWSPDRQTFYFADTLENIIYAYNYDESDGSICNERPFFRGYERGSPDGSQVDSAGYLWNCRFHGKCIVCLAPDGTIHHVVEMPVSNITSCTFGGPDLRTLYITTAAVNAPRGERLAGGLFALETAVAGQPENRFRVFGGRRKISTGSCSL
jgi:sugar lactone lactonase YvrE